MKKKPCLNLRTAVTSRKSAQTLRAVSAFKGFSLLDLIITLSIIAVLVSICVPSMQILRAKMESYALTSQIRSTLALAKTTAVSEGKRVTVCNLSMDKRCERNNLSNLSVFFDSNKNRKLDDDERLAAVSEFRYSGSISWRASSRARHLEFTRYGSSSRAGSFIFCRKGYEDFAGRITLSMSGRVYSGRDRNGDGRVELASGKPISCD